MYNVNNKYISCELYLRLEFLHLLGMDKILISNPGNSLEYNEEVRDFIEFAFGHGLVNNIKI